MYDPAPAYDDDYYGNYCDGKTNTGFIKLQSVNNNTLPTPTSNFNPWTPSQLFCTLSPIIDDTQQLESSPIHTHNGRVLISIENKNNEDNEDNDVWYYIYADIQALTSDSVPVPVPVSLEDLVINSHTLLVINSHNLVLNDIQPYEESSQYLCVPSPSFFSDYIATTGTANLQSEPELGSPICCGVFSYEGGSPSENCESKIDNVNVLLPKKSIINSKRKERSGDSIYEHGIESPKKSKKSKNINNIINVKQCKKTQCEHGTNKYRCRICGGSAICVHGNERYRCKECGGASICVHNKQRTRCKECGGSSICVHGGRRTQCKECRCSSICVHGIIRKQCKECVKAHANN